MAMADGTLPTNVDLAALATLKLVYLHGSFTRAAEILDRNQSSVSYTIDKLRAVFRDPLFVRVGARMTPTDRCLDIVEFATATLDRFNVVVDPESIDLGAIADEVTISCNQYQRKLLLPGFFRELTDKAPRVKLKVITASNRGRTHLLGGEADILICPTEIEGAGLYRRILMHDEYVCVMDRHNPLLAQAMDIDAFVNARHAVLNYGDGWKSGYQAELDRRGLRLQQAIVLPSPEDLAFVLPGSDLISVLPRRLAVTLGNDYRIVNCPVPGRFSIKLYWTRRTHHSPLFQWLRGELVASAASI